MGRGELGADEAGYPAHASQVRHEQMLRMQVILLMCQLGRVCPRMHALDQGALH